MQASLFRALCLSRNIREVVVAYVLCVLLVRCGNASRISLYHSSCETVHMYFSEHLRGSHRVLDQDF